MAWESSISDSPPWPWETPVPCEVEPAARRPRQRIRRRGVVASVALQHDLRRPLSGYRPDSCRVEGRRVAGRGESVTLRGCLRRSTAPAARPFAQLVAELHAPRGPEKGRNPYSRRSSGRCSWPGFGPYGVVGHFVPVPAASAAHPARAACRSPSWPPPRERRCIADESIRSRG